ncbi:nedd8-activating enzyme e1 catalytic subunit [Cystoisospora suis]|uniref:NEDD8-activating enzyme E1 catalytic subunit n=1 Tax=Cystoisospora suis TaxID=483139 RepID=A0A2C6KMI2_9APIC|nr:nedd8-activating enzyme e1 catalytic subunit [Cystoisospora suis]
MEVEEEEEHIPLHTVEIRKRNKVTSSSSSSSSSSCPSYYTVGHQSNQDESYHLRCLLNRHNPFSPPQSFFTDHDELAMSMEKKIGETRVLVVGAGGLGCEVLKCLCLSGFKKLTVIDMDFIQVTNLHRQFLFRAHHVGRSKALVAAEVLNAQFAHLHVQVTGVPCRLEEKDASFYRQFQLVVSGLDSIEARRWLNAQLHSLVERDDETNGGEIDLKTCIPLLDGGTEGFRGQARIIFPFVTSCFECSLDSFPPQVSYPLCTIAETPRLPEHCIEYAMLISWDQEKRGETFDSDNAVHVRWAYESAKKRAEHFGISGVTHRLTLGVVKRIIPAVASTNAIIAGMLVEEAVKISTYCICSTHDLRVAQRSSEKEKVEAISRKIEERGGGQEEEEKEKGTGEGEQEEKEKEKEEEQEDEDMAGSGIQDYVMYMGQDGVYTHTFEYAKKPECVICSGTVVTKKIDPDETTLEDLLELLAEDPSLKLTSPSISSASGVLFLQRPPQLRRQFEQNLSRSLRDLSQDGLLSEREELLVTDPALPSAVRLRLIFGEKTSGEALKTPTV